MLTRLLAASSALPLAACQPPIEVGTPPPPDSYMACDKLPTAPDLKPLEAITLDDGRNVYLKSEVDARDAHIARYVVEVRGAWFSCYNQIETIRDYYEGAE